MLEVAVRSCQTVLFNLNNVIWRKTTLITNQHMTSENFVSLRVLMKITNVQTASYKRTIFGEPREQLGNISSLKQYQFVDFLSNRAVLKWAHASNNPEIYRNYWGSFLEFHSHTHNDIQKYDRVDLKKLHNKQPFIFR